MRKMICILGLSLILSGCSNDVVDVGDREITISEEANSVIDKNEKTMYIEDDLKDVIVEINALSEKYKDSVDEDSSYTLYIDIYDGSNVVANFDNDMFNKKEYFNDLVEILDKNMAEGLKEHITDMKDKEIPKDKIILRKMGRVAVYAENNDDYGEREENFISIRINFSDLEDKYYSELFNKVADDKYFLENMTIGDKLNMMDFSNIRNYSYIPNDEYLNLRYNIYLKDKDIEKVNILMQGRRGLELEQDDIDVFVNMMNTLELGQEDKALLLSDYKNIFEARYINKKLSLDKYNVLINSDKGSAYSGKDNELVYFSIEKI